jgi:mannose/fructose/N-acetylgalactosamine-specific phosphotransferase system component IIC
MKLLSVVILIGSLVTFFIVSNYTPKDHSEIIAIASPLATIAGILFGFVFASSTFLSGNSNNELLKNLKKQNMYVELIEQLHRTGLWLIASCLFMVISILSPYEPLFKTFNWDYCFLMAGFWCLICGLIDFWYAWRKVRLVITYL